MNFFTTKSPPSTPVDTDAVAQMKSDRQEPETLPRQSREVRPNFSDGPWTLVRFFTDQILPEGFDLDQYLSDSGIMINMVPHIVEHKHAGSYELVVATSCLDVLSEKFQHFKIVVDYDPFEPAEEDIRNHGIWEANKRARINTLTTLLKRPAMDGGMDRQNAIVLLSARLVSGQSLKEQS